MKYEHIEDAFTRFIHETTHGGGLDYEYEFSIKEKTIRLKTHWHLMNDNGYYIGGYPVTAWFADNHGVYELIKVRCQNSGKMYGIREYLEEVFHDAAKEYENSEKA